MRNRFILLLIIIGITTSCKTGVEVTFTNESNEDFKELTVGIFKKQFDFENLKSGQTTDAIKVEQIFPYCYARAITEKDTLKFMPIDFMGEKLKKRGKLNLKINIDSISDEKRRLDFITNKN